MLTPWSPSPEICKQCLPWKCFNIKQARERMQA